MKFNIHQIIFGIILIIVIILTYSEKSQWTKETLKTLKRPFGLAIILLFSSVILNSLFENRWDMKYIFDFLILKEVGDWFFLMQAALSYFLILPSIEIYLIVLGKELGIIQID